MQREEIPAARAEDAPGAAALDEEEVTVAVGDGRRRGCLQRNARGVVAARVAGNERLKQQVGRPLLADLTAQAAGHAVGSLFALAELLDIDVDDHVAVRRAPLPPPDFAVAAVNLDQVTAVIDAQGGRGIGAFLKAARLGEILYDQLLTDGEFALRAAAAGGEQDRNSQQGQLG